MLIKLPQKHKARESTVFKLGSADYKEYGQCVLEDLVLYRGDHLLSSLPSMSKGVAFVSFLSYI